ncbi:hypothetical protein HF838_19295 [Aneurinibacillus aneurinilyticus]|uniref:Uncharacterized protein n=3 Tax=Aneurinibacillus aneurinilyticus TaxID=1391 RepID=A0A848CZN4_ANEAE|nr:hypothetical protein HMPREF0083_05855 [Aneurinibacillus aneurinilyticus ATCC 12856]NMF00372.1 hypothetical protein [Aneurinibacillus aneurinilyticus]
MMKLISAIRELPVLEHEVMGQGILELTDIKSSPYPGASVVPSLCTACTAAFERRLLVGETKESVLAPIIKLIDKLQSEDQDFRATAGYTAIMKVLTATGFKEKRME